MVKIDDKPTPMSVPALVAIGLFGTIIIWELVELFIPAPIAAGFIIVVGIGICTLIG